jgi:hypothetical protein
VDTGANLYSYLQSVPFIVSPNNAAVTGCPVGCMLFLRDRTARLRGLIKATPLVLMGLFLISRQKYRRRCSVCGSDASDDLQRMWDTAVVV